ncbi:uncharacterized protein BHQ10_010287 [Talaromyces amestolkiae]|uniref:Uncharacterized protein n=1 Tax=Talaromyces amestolkiae TaxID=1196081 RepID=A0A364LEM8_TALAM|nr:uncharacterized protein BHQ10_010287 [Talaromyces amestolkiae]RAO74275.1 hypothetical protein BHQ10_010287 [Talaromyces amestolkiae]
MFQSLKRLAKTQLSNNVSSHKSPPLENVNRPTARHFAIHLFYGKLNTILYRRFYAYKVGMSHSCRKETPAHGMVLRIGCAEEGFDAAMSNVAVKVGFAVMAANSMDFFDRVDFGNV